MAENSNIEWTKHTFNPWIGCQKVGAGCDHCYAETFDNRFNGNRWGPHATRTRTSAANWKKPLAWDRAAAKAGERHRVFCASLADVFDNHASVLPEWLRELGRIAYATPNLIWMFLTKRIGNADRILREMFPDGIPENVWIGATIVNQTEADRDIPKLLSVPARVRFLSIEPLLGPIDLRHTVPMIGCGAFCEYACTVSGDQECGRHCPSIDLVIVGGESGPNARPMHPDWARSLRDQCNAAGVAFHFKQWGEWLPANQSDYLGDDVDGVRFGCWNDAGDWVDSPSWKFANAGRKVSFRIGKKTAGRELDGRTWDEMPEVSRV